MPNPWAAPALQICGFAGTTQSFEFLKCRGREQRLTPLAEQPPLAEVTLPGKLTLEITVLPLPTRLILVISSSISALK